MTSEPTLECTCVVGILQVVLYVSATVAGVLPCEQPLFNLLKLNTTAAGYALHLLYAIPLLLGVSWTKQTDREHNCRGRLLVLGTSTQ